MGSNSSIRRSVGALSVTLLVAVSLIAGTGAVAASHTEGNAVFPNPVEISVAGITVSVGPPQDVDGDGLYNDLNGDGEVTLLDAVLHAVVVTAVDAGELDLTNDQASAVDVNGDGEVTYDDALELAMSTDMGAQANA